MRKILTKNFFERPTLTVARELLGKYLVRRHISLIRTNKGYIKKTKEVALMITETEGYDGFKDKASHAHRGKTARNHVMFGEAGVWYVYFTYGMHWMLNIVVGKKEYPAAVLIRGTEEVSGPARLTKFLRIDKAMNKKPAIRKSGLWIEDRPAKTLSKKFQAGKGIGAKYKIVRTPRIGIRYAKEWARKPYRFVLEHKR